MALKTGPTKKAAPPPEDTTILELALYTNYTWGGFTYEKGKPYRFMNKEAIQLLAEMDHGRPVWKLYKAPVKRSKEAPEIMDATSVESKAGGEDLTGLDPKAKRIDVGTDDEIADILAKVETEGDDTGNVTV